jgi:enolase
LAEKREEKKMAERMNFFPLGGQRIRGFEIAGLRARQILDSRGNPTVEVDVRLRNGGLGRASVPSGASTGTREALELRDGGKGFEGKYVLTAVNNANTEIAGKVIGMNALDQEALDRAMIELDGTENKRRLGANAILGVSIATARAAADAIHIPLYELIGGPDAHILPVPMFNVLNAGAHANWVAEIQEKKIVPINFKTYREALFAAAKVYQALQSLLKADGYPIGLGDEGGFAPPLTSNEASLVYIMRAFIKAGFKPGRDFFIALDPAASGYFGVDIKGRKGIEGKYNLASEDRDLTPAEKVAYLAELVEKYPILLIEDGLAEEDSEGWKLITAKLGNRIELVGDDLFVTNPKILAQGISDGIANGILIKANQIGTLWETYLTVNMAREAGYAQYWSHRSGEPEDNWLAHTVVAAGSGQLKTGAPARGERTAKYNELLRIEEELGERAVYPGISAFPEGVRRFAAERAGKWDNWNG